MTDMTLDVVNEAIQRANDRKSPKTKIALTSSATPPEGFGGGKVLARHPVDGTVRQYTLVELHQLREFMTRSKTKSRES